MNIEPVAVFHSPLAEKFGIPRQAGIAESLLGTIELKHPYNMPDALRGLEKFDYIWLIWGFNLNSRRNSASEEHSGTAAASGGGANQKFEATVRPPRLGGNTRIGVFASRSPFRPNGLGLSAVKIVGIDLSRCTIEVCGADLADGTPIYDIKPYVEYADSHSGIRSGFVDDHVWKTLEVRIPPHVEAELGPAQVKALEEILSQDPRPKFQNDPERIYGMNFAGTEIRFRVSGDILEVL